MAITVTFFADMFTSIGTLTDSAVGTMTAYAGNLKPLAGACWLIYGLYQAFRILTNSVSSLYKEVAYDFLRITIVCYFVFNSGTYVSSVVPFVRETGLDITSIITGSGIGVNPFDKLLADYVVQVNKIVDSFGIFDWGQILASALFLIVFSIGVIVFLTIGIVLMLTVNLATALLAVVGLIYILFYLYPPTRSWFFSWLSAVMNYIILTVLFNIAMGIMMAITNAAFTVQNTPSSVSLFGMGVMMMAFCYFLKEIPSISSNLTNGAHMMGNNGAGQAKQALNKALSSLVNRFKKDDNNNQGSGNRIKG